MMYGTFVEAFGKLSNEITFLSRTVPQKNDKYFIRVPVMKYILIEPSDIEPNRFRGVATDGKRMHIVDPLSSPDDCGLEAGLWRPLKMGGATAWIAQVKEKQKGFPDYRKVLPHDEPLKIFQLALPRGSSMGNLNFLVTFFREFPEPTAINLNYLHSLEHGRMWKVGWYSSDDAVTFESDNYAAVIMPRDMGKTK